MRAGAAACLTAALLCSGCFSYVPLNPGSVLAGERVRVQVVGQGPVLPTRSATVLSGTVVDVDGEQLLLSVPVGVVQEGVIARTVGQEVELPRSQIAWLQRRKFDRARTVLAIAGVVAGGVALYLGFGEGRPVPETPTPPVDEEAGSVIRVPLFTLPLW